MLTYYLPDITGVNPDYLKVNMPFFFWKASTKIEFKSSPVFMDSLRITTTDGLSSLLERGTDYVVGDDDIDNDAMSRAFGQDPNFTKILLKSVTMKSTKGLGQRLALLYQEFYLTAPGGIVDDGRPIEITPDLIKSLVAGQADLRQQIARVASPVAPVGQAPKLLPLDINQERPGNKVIGEVTQVNTVIGQKVIRPTQGLFFADSVQIKVDNQLLDKNSDYLPIDLSTLTKQTTNKSGIYRYLVLLKPVTGTVTIDYHAVGGEVQQDDLHKTFDTMLAIKSFLGDSLFITADTVADTPAMRAAYARINQLETSMRSLLVGAPTYNDTTAHQAVLRPVQSVNANFHWWTIASLYQVNGSTDLIMADQFKGRVFFPGAKVALSFTVDVNFDQTRNPVSFKTDSVVFDPTYVLFGEQSVAAPVYPLLRVIWDQSGQSYGGALLQIGLPLVNLQDTMAVEDLSTTESGWLLNKTNRQIPGGSPVSPSSPADDNVTLPDGHTLWSSANSTAKVKTFLPEYRPGYLLWTGSTVDVNIITTTNSTENLFTVKLPAYVPLTTLRDIIVTLTSPDGSNPYDVIIPLPTTTSSTRAGRAAFTSNTDVVVSFLATLRVDSFGNMKFNLVAKGGINVPDQIRYVRVRP